MIFKIGLLVLCSCLGWAIGPLQAQTTRSLVSEVDNPLAERAVEWQNTAFIAEALRGDFKSALAASDSALQLWRMLGSKPEIAKLYRYKAYLLAQLQRPAEAKVAIQTAKILFQQQKAVYGLALTHFEWGKICLLAQELDSALYYTELALKWWRAEKHDSRIFQAKTQLLYLHARRLNFPEAARLREELAEAMQGCCYAISRLDKVNYWYANLYFSEKQQDWSAYEQYNRQYTAMITEFAAEGSKVTSFFNNLEELPELY